MGVVNTRPTTQVGGHGNADAGIGHYAGIYSAVRDLRMWFDYWGVSRKRLGPDFFGLYNPSDSYPAVVRGVRSQIGLGLSVLAILFPLTTLVITKIWK